MISTLCNSRDTVIKRNNEQTPLKNPYNSENTTTPAMSTTANIENSSTLQTKVLNMMTLNTPKRGTKAPPTRRPMKEAKLRIESWRSCECELGGVMGRENGDMAYGIETEGCV